MNIAERSLNLLVARMAWATRISKRDGFDVPWYDYTSGFNVQPKKFVFDLKARSTSKAKFVERTWLKGKARDPLAGS